MTPTHIHVTERPPEPATGAHAQSDCRFVATVLARIGDKWAVLVVRLLGDGPVRFSELRRRIGGISQRMLTLTLRGLERDGLVSRTVHATVPPKVEYDLTPLGRSLLAPIRALGDWAFSHQAEIESARARFDVAAAKAAGPKLIAARLPGRAA
jgi:DNA-binding HxlR family transcriptional regulator